MQFVATIYFVFIETIKRQKTNFSSPQWNSTSVTYKQMHTSSGIFVPKHIKYLFKGVHLPSHHSALVCFYLYGKFFHATSSQCWAQPSASHMQHILQRLLYCLPSLFGLPLWINCYSASLLCAQRIFPTVSSTGWELCPIHYLSEHRLCYGIEIMNTETLMVWHLDL